MSGFDLGERIEQVFASGIEAETSIGLAARLGVDEDDVLVELISLVADGSLTLVEEGGLLLFLTPARSRELELAA